MANHLNHLLVQAKLTFGSPIDMRIIFNYGLVKSAAKLRITSVV